MTYMNSFTAIISTFNEFQDPIRGKRKWNDNRTNSFCGDNFGVFAFVARSALDGFHIFLIFLSLIYGFIHITVKWRYITVSSFGCRKNSKIDLIFKLHFQTPKIYGFVCARFFRDRLKAAVNRFVSWIEWIISYVG